MKRIIILGVVVVAVVIAWSAGWWFVANTARTVVLSLADADGVTTPKLTCSRLGVGGWPFQVNLDCAEPVLVSGDTSLSLPDLQAAVVVYDPMHALIFAKGPLTVADAFTGSRVALAWSHLEASTRLTNWRIGRISVVGDQLELTDALMGNALIASASHAEAHLLDLPGQHDATRGLAALRSYVVFKDVNAPGLQIDKGEVTLDANIANVPDDVRTYGDADFLRRWQAAGGDIVINQLKGNDGDNFFDVTGKLALDAEGRPSGQVKIASKGVVERLGGLVPDNMRGLILGNADQNGTYTQTLTMNGGVLLAGIVPVAGLAPLF